MFVNCDNEVDVYEGLLFPVKYPTLLTPHLSESVTAYVAGPRVALSLSYSTLADEEIAGPPHLTAKLESG